MLLHAKHRLHARCLLHATGILRVSLCLLRLPSAQIHSWLPLSVLCALPPRCHPPLPSPAAEPPLLLSGVPYLLAHPRQLVCCCCLLCCAAGLEQHQLRGARGLNMIDGAPQLQADTTHMHTSILKQVCHMLTRTHRCMQPQCQHAHVCIHMMNYMTDGGTDDAGQALRLLP